MAGTAVAADTSTKVEASPEILHQLNKLSETALQEPASKVLAKLTDLMVDCRELESQQARVATAQQKLADAVQDYDARFYELIAKRLREQDRGWCTRCREWVPEAELKEIYTSAFGPGPDPTNDLYAEYNKRRDRACPSCVTECMEAAASMLSRVCRYVTLMGDKLVAQSPVGYYTISGEVPPPQAPKEEEFKKMAREFELTDVHDILKSF
jgi:hypothetical protein